MKSLVTSFVVMFACLQAAWGNQVTNIGPSEAQQLLASGVKIVDVRTQMEWQQSGVVPGSHTITAFLPSGQTNSEFGKDFKALAAADEPVILICRSGRRSAAVSGWLAGKAGYTKVYNLEGGIQRWMAEGQPVEAYMPDQ